MGTCQFSLAWFALPMASMYSMYNYTIEKLWTYTRALLLCLALVILFYRYSWSSEPIHPLFPVDTHTMGLTRSELLALNCDLKLPHDVWTHIKELGIYRKPATRRGTRGGRRKIKKNDGLSSPTGNPRSDSRRQTTLKACLWNSQSIRNKSDLLCDSVLDNNFDIIFITETWLKEDDRVILGEIRPPGFSVLSLPRKTACRGGGIAAVYDSNLKLKDCSDTLPEASSFELALFRNPQVNFLVIYRPPSGSLPSSTFFEEFEEVLSCADLLPNRLVVMGDFNFHMDCPSKPEVRNFNALLTSLGYKQLVQGPTHRLGHTLDLIIIKDSDTLIKTCFVDQILHSDHSMIKFDLDLKRPAPSSDIRVLRKFKSIDHEQFSHDLSSRMNSIMDCDSSNIDDLVLQYNKACCEVLDIHAPATTRTMSVRVKPSWYTDKVVEARRARRRAERRWRKTKSNIDRRLYIEAQRTVCDVVVSAKKDYYRDRLSSCNTKDMYKTVNELLNVSSNVLPVCTNSSDLAEDFSDYFVSKVSKIRDDIESTVQTKPNAPTVSSNTCESDFTFAQFDSVSEDVLQFMISKCPSKSCTLDPMPTWLVKKHLPVLLPVLLRIVNMSLSTGVFPERLRSSIITPVLKKSSLDKDDLGSYRPVSNIPFLGKLIEKAVSKQVSNFVNRNDLLDPMQSAYRVAHSTETALIRLQNDVLCAIDNRQAVFLLMLDLSSAFDTVDHTILSHRLADDFGLRDNVLSWFNSYLSNRSCRVHVNGSFSSDKRLEFGIPQGSIVGPQLFTYYIRCIGNIISQHSVQYHVYADDIQMFTIFDPAKPGDAACAYYRISKCLEDIQSWLVSNKLKLNSGKTEFFIAASPTDLNRFNDLSFSIDGQDIPMSATIKDLGVVFDKEMKMSDHVTNLCRTLNWQIYNLNRIRGYLDKDTCHNVVRALVLSRLDYGGCLLGGISKQDLGRLQRLQNKCARLICQKPKWSFATPLLNELHWLPVSKRIQYRILVQTYKSLLTTLPQYISSLFQQQRTSYSLRSTSAPSYVIPKSRKQAGFKSFQSLAPRLWNKLPTSLRNITSLDLFKKHLKTYLYNS